MEKRGQAAMEFLMTYGWAILAAIIAIGALAYFGVFSPGRYTPETCILSAPFGCSDDSVAKVAEVDLIIINGGGEDYNISSISLTNCEPAITPGTTHVSGAEVTYTITCLPILTLGARFNGNIEITYTKVGGTRELTSTGSIARKKVI